MKKILSILLLLIFPYVTFSQQIKALPYDQIKITKAFIKDTLKIDAYIKKAIQLPFSEEKEAKFYYQKALDLAYNLRSQEQIAKVFLEKGLYYRENFNYFESIKSFNKALPYFENTKESKLLSKLYFFLGQSYFFVYSEDISFKYYLKALNLYKKNQNEIGVAYCYNGIGTIYSNTNHKVALNYLNKSLALFKKNNYYKGIATCYINIANATEKTEESVVLYNKSIAVLKLQNDNYTLAVNYNNLGDSYIHLEEFDRAIAYFQKGLAISEKMDAKPLHAMLYLNIAEVKLKQKLYDDAIYYSNLSLDFATKKGDVEIQAANILALSSIYESRSDIKKALEYKNEYIAARDRALKYKDQKKVQLYQSLNELDRSQYELQKLKIENENADLKLQSKNNQTYFFIFLTLVLVAVVVILFLQKKAKNKINAELQFQTQQISNLKDNVQVQNDRLNDINNTKNKLFKIIAHDLKNPLSSIEALSDLMLQDQGGADEEEKVLFLNLIKESATKASEILNDVLIWALDQEKPVENKKLSIKTLINEELKLLEIQASQKEISIHNTIDADLNVVTDKNKVATVLRNLISNAIKFSYTKGAITISAAVEKKFIKISVSDQGIGMTTEEMHNLFIVDYKKSRLGTSNEEGTGLGLVLCKDFVQKLGGTITVSSELNKGSVFSFTLPYDGGVV
ncbi:tetratricopeptide repeat-containing sensor histidine kinase [Flavobacterium sp.]|uniref:tetratricopeptide repeat-containing sensor histidine kinase n=1 Tax=Flavobacterium sp. TaxID=239 RepID=UPI002627970C|nr:tetratricopeptide repeat-containing sensor histidine kinase [Flavobacterium sp.]MDG2431092.1 tetratricopeptide repeat-containing sensor histidine kinase [Flavobacterium sp.]